MMAKLNFMELLTEQVFTPSEVSARPISYLHVTQEKISHQNTQLKDHTELF